MERRRLAWKAKVQLGLARLDSWLTIARVARASLFLVNSLLALKASSIMLALANNSRALIIESNGATLFSAPLRLCLGLLNFLIFSSSTSCLLAVTLPESRAHEASGGAPARAQLEARRLAAKCFVVSQMLLALLALCLMGQLWFAPPRLSPMTNDWASAGAETTAKQLQVEAQLKREIADYNFTFAAPAARALAQEAAGGVGVGEQLARALWARHKPRALIDELQLAFACCGLAGPADWLAGPANRSARLLAPSCCARPHFIELDAVGAASGKRRWFAFCSSPNGSSSSPPPPLGCKRALEEREPRALFRARLALLLLLAALFFNIFTYVVALDGGAQPPPPPPSPSNLDSWPPRGAGQLFVLSGH